MSTDPNIGDKKEFYFTHAHSPKGTNCEIAEIKNILNIISKNITAEFKPNLFRVAEFYLNLFSESDKPLIIEKLDISGY